MRFIPLKRDRILMIIYSIIICLGIVRIQTDKSSLEAFEVFLPTNKKIIYIDAGHGGWDPGKVANNGALEKDINLEISKKLQMLLEQSGAIVITTRLEDKAVGDTKNKDLNKRTWDATRLKADIFVSIHQNSYPNPKVHGAQVFYYEGSDNSLALAESIQASINSFIEHQNKKATGNSAYYMLKKTTVPAVIVECGFMSNSWETTLLSSDEYQNKIAWAIYTGIMDYFNNKTE